MQLAASAAYCPEAAADMKVLTSLVISIEITCDIVGDRCIDHMVLRPVRLLNFTTTVSPDFAHAAVLSVVPIVA